jgi:hypothetical protein
MRCRPARGEARLGGVSGHVAESVVEIVLVESGYVPLAHHAGPGRHGIDLLMLHLACDMLIAVEVKSTLSAGRLPRLHRGELAQMSAQWVDKPDNPGLVSAGVGSQDIYGALAAVNFADATLRMLMSADFTTFIPVTSPTQLHDPSWLKDNA